MEGDSVTLYTGVTEICEGDDIIQSSPHYIPDGRFRDRLKLDSKTGSLTIKNITSEHAGVYQLEISGRRHLSCSSNILINQIKLRFALYPGRLSANLLYNHDSKRLAKLNFLFYGDSVTLNTDVTEIHEVEDIFWNYRDENFLIAKINREIQISSIYDDVLDGRFRDRLKLDNQTGSLTITNMRTEHAGVYQLQISGVKVTLKTFMSVMEGDSVLLHTNVTEIHDDDILWNFGAEKSLIAEITRDAGILTTFDSPDGRFRDRLKLDNQTGSLTITNITTQHTGVYQLEIIATNIIQMMSVMEGDSILLHTDVTEIHEDEDIQWTFGAVDSLISLAEITKAAGICFTYNGPDGRFRDRLKLDNQTGSLTITNITTQHAGLYKLEITGAKLSSKTFSVSIYGDQLCHTCSGTAALILVSMYTFTYINVSP
uniref:Immunoglobulin domain-containing protein n=1 Tax=Sinocyclocheilus rhinocerous TaxID=307959 RepID=A0A673HJF1_9TELE